MKINSHPHKNIIVGVSMAIVFFAATYAWIKHQAGIELGNQIVDQVRYTGKAAQAAYKGRMNYGPSGFNLMPELVRINGLPGHLRVSGAGKRLEAIHAGGGRFEVESHGTTYEVGIDEVSAYVCVTLLANEERIFVGARINGHPIHYGIPASEDVADRLCDGNNNMAMIGRVLG